MSRGLNSGVRAPWPRCPWGAGAWADGTDVAICAMSSSAVRQMTLSLPRPFARSRMEVLLSDTVTRGRRITLKSQRLLSVRHDHFRDHPGFRILDLGPVKDN